MLRKYIIERDVPGVGGNTVEGFSAIAKKSSDTLNQLGTDIQWQESFIVGDRTYCVYLARDENLIREHAERSGFPANRIEEVKYVLDPSHAAA